MEPIVLVVEDDDDNRELVAAVLRDGGYGVLAAEDGCRALDLLEHARTPPAALLTDLRMPNMSGLELLERMRQHPAFCLIPTAIMTAEPPRRSRDPQVPVLQKPFDDVQLLRVIDALCQRARPPAPQPT
jgi:CheY-like chemotaxis protein